MRKRKCKKQQAPQQSMIGRIIDMPLEDFKTELAVQKTTIGVMSNLKLNLVSIYNDLTIRKDGIINKILKGELVKDDPQVKDILNGLYAEMTKVEQKALYLTERIKELMNLDSGDTTSGEVDSLEK